MIDKKIFSKKNIVIGIVILGILIALPHIFNSAFSHQILIMICIWSIYGMGWNVIGGYAGQVSNGHAIFAAFGAYTCAIACTKFGITPWISIWIGVLISAVIAYAIGKPLLRLKGAIFAIATQAIAECVRLIFINSKFLGGSTGVYIYSKKLDPLAFMQFTSDYQYYYLYLVITLLILGLMFYLDKSKFFYYLRAIRGNETAAKSSGINTGKYKMYAYILSGVLVSIGGSLYIQFMKYCDPSQILQLADSVMIVLVVVMGGLGTVMGPILGAIVLTYISQYSRVYLSAYSGLDLVIYGALVIVIVLFLPKGIISLPATIRSAVAKAKKRKVNEANNGEEVSEKVLITNEEDDDA